VDSWISWPQEVAKEEVMNPGVHRMKGSGSFPVRMTIKQLRQAARRK